ncbi:hypothetical protein [Glaciecola sp. 1036]|uniref:hypothetical protein n=1 Tax=Alteromonadaceae TaxID=72275 RepID=UPI003D01A625
MKLAKKHAFIGCVGILVFSAASVAAVGAIQDENMLKEGFGINTVTKVTTDKDLEALSSFEAEFSNTEFNMSERNHKLRHQRIAEIIEESRELYRSNSPKLAENHIALARSGLEYHLSQL